MRTTRLARPLYVVCMTGFLCLTASRAIGAHLTIAAEIGALLLLAAACAVRRLRHDARIMAALLTAVVAFSWLSCREWLIVRPLAQYDGRTLSATVRLERAANSRYENVYYARVLAGKLPPGTRLALRVPADETAPQLYDTYAASMTVTATDTFRGAGCYLSAYASKGEATPCKERPWYAPFVAFRQEMIGHTREYLDTDAGALVRAVCFADKAELSDTVREDFAAAGFSHLMAVSGFHMTVIVLGIFWLWRAFGLKRRWAALLSLPMLVFFLILCGGAYSTLRAGVMCLVMLTGQLFRRRADGKNSLGAAVGLILLIQPDAVYDVGFLLSVTAVWSILVVNALFADKRPGRLCAALRMTGAATLGTLPVVALTFQRLPLLTPLANLLGEPLAAVIVPCGCAGTLLGALPPLAFLAKGLLLVAGTAARLLELLAGGIASLTVVWSLDQPYMVAWACALPPVLYAGYRLLGARGVHRAVAGMGLALTAGMLIFTIGMRGVSTMTALPTADGTAVLLERDGHRALILTDGVTDRDFADVIYRFRLSHVDLLIRPEELACPLAADAVLAGEGQADLWGDAVTVKDGFIRLVLGDTSLLICEAGGCAADLPEQQRQATALIFDHLPPEDAAVLQAAQGICCCSEQQRPLLTRQLPWGQYPIAVVSDGVWKGYTRGNGDITVARGGESDAVG